MAKTTFPNRYSKPLDVSRSFDKEKITLLKAGVEYNVYDAIQKAKGDCDIYETLRKYNMNPTFENAAQFLGRKDGAQALYGDMTALQEGKDLRDLEQQLRDADAMFDRLPNEIKQEFNNDKFKFMKEGTEWLKNKLQEQAEKNHTIQKEEGVNNEPKQ